MAVSLAAGKRVKDFTLKDQNGQDFTLSAFKGKKVLLSFHPLAWTSICAKQMQALEKNVKVFEKAGAVAVGLSVDSVPLQDRLGRNLKIRKTRLLADFGHGRLPPPGAVPQGLLRSAPTSRRRGQGCLDQGLPGPKLPDIRCWQP